MKWTDEQVANLKELCREGKSNKEIATALGCRVEDVYGKRSQLGITKAKIAGELKKDLELKKDPELKPIEESMIMKIRKREYEAKDAILKELTKALSLANPDIDTLELSVDMEHVQIRYKNGYRRTACIAADSKIAMIVDVAKTAMR